MRSNDFDVVIIGGGPAGSVAGINLARAGINTAIIERKSFPRETLCGEFLSSEVSRHLKELNLFERFISLNPNPVTSFKLITRTGKVFDTTLPFTAYSLKRSVFDNFLLNEAGKSGVHVLQPAEVLSVSIDNSSFRLQLKTTDGYKTITAGYVIGAYGKSNLLDKQLKRNFSSHRSGFNAIKFHIKKELLSDICDPVIYIFSGRDIYCGINAVSDQEAVVCFLYKKGALNETPSEKFNKLLDENKKFSSVFWNKIEISNMDLYGAGNIYLGKRELIKDGIMMIGDAAGMIAPVAGDGIGMAIQSAKTAAGIIRNHFKENNRDKIYNIYRIEWVKLFSKRIYIANLIQNSILKNYPEKLPAITNLLLPYSILATRK
jgi:flavin-dependent dehydrogenase